LDTSKLKGLGWRPQADFHEGLRQTVAWYRENEWWWRPIKDQNPAFKAYYAQQYTNRA
jgi:dTDP-glucose 4,6-dehydratase